MRTTSRSLRYIRSIAIVALLTAVHPAFAAKPAATIPPDKLIQPAQLAAQLQDDKQAKLMILQVGFKTMFDQAHIPGSEYAGPANSDAGLQVLRSRVAKLARDSDIVIYCGCCPWSRCPNIAAAYDALIELGFTHVRVLHIAENFGTDWVDRGYPASRESP